MASEDRSDDQHILLIPFHKGRTYENTVYGLSLRTEGGKIAYNNTKQKFIEMCETADGKPAEKFVIILDDVNRSDLSRALGDVMQALESSGKNRSIPIEGETVEIPDNLYIIATANPTFGSAPDYAWLRRFLVFDIMPDEQHITAPEYIRFRNLFDNGNYFVESDYEKFLDYSYCIFTYVKIMYERYFTDDDPVIKLQNCPGHGMFMLPYVEDKTFEFQDYVKLFHLKLKHIIVPFLRSALADGILKNDDFVRFDIDMFDQLGNYKILKRSIFKDDDISDSFDMIVSWFKLNVDTPLFYFLYLRNPLMMRRPKDGYPKKFFLYEPKEHIYKKINNTKDEKKGVDLHKWDTQDISNKSLNKPTSLALNNVRTSESGNASPGYISISFYKIFGRICPGVFNIETNEVRDTYKSSNYATANQIAMKAVINGLFKLYSDNINSE